MSLLRPGQVLSGAHWRYRIVEALHGDTTHLSSVFKAQVLEENTVSTAPQWAVIKEASSKHTSTMTDLAREKQTYRLPGIASAACVRKMYDAIDEKTVALEWLDSTLQDIKYQPTMHTYTLIKESMKSALSCAAILDSHKFQTRQHSAIWLRNA